jgi:hypothetical protein
MSMKLFVFLNIPRKFKIFVNTHMPRKLVTALLRKAGLEITRKLNSRETGKF